MPCRQRYGSISSAPGVSSVYMAEKRSPAASFGNTTRKWSRQISAFIATRRSNAARASSGSPPKSSASISAVSSWIAGRYCSSQRRRSPSMWSPITGMCCCMRSPICSGATASTGLL